VQSAGFRVLGKGLQRSTALTLLLPEASARLSLRARNLLNKIIRVLLPWHRGIMNMAYCVGQVASQH
jgi:hypothetical protein